MFDNAALKRRTMQCDEFVSDQSNRQSDSENPAKAVGVNTSNKVRALRKIY